MRGILLAIKMLIWLLFLIFMFIFALPELNSIREYISAVSTSDYHEYLKFPQFVVMILAMMAFVSIIAGYARRGLFMNIIIYNSIILVNALLVFLSFQVLIGNELSWWGFIWRLIYIPIVIIFYIDIVGRFAHLFANSNNYSRRDSSLSSSSTQRKSSSSAGSIFKGSFGRK